MGKIKMNHDADSTYQAIFGTEEEGDKWYAKHNHKLVHAINAINRKGEFITNSRIAEEALKLMTDEEKETLLLLQLMDDGGRVMAIITSDCDCENCSRIKQMYIDRIEHELDEE